MNKNVVVLIIIVLLFAVVIAINRQQCSVEIASKYELVFQQCKGEKFILHTDKWDFDGIIPANNYTISLQETPFVRVHIHSKEYWIIFSELKG